MSLTLQEAIWKKYIVPTEREAGAFSVHKAEATRTPYEQLKNAINRRFCYIRAVLKPKNSSLSFLPIDLSSELCYNDYNKHIHSGGVP